MIESAAPPGSSVATLRGSVGTIGIPALIMTIPLRQFGTTASRCVNRRSDCRVVRYSAVAPRSN